MSNDLNLVAELREDQGKGASRRLRRSGGVPAILYGGGRPPRAITLNGQKLRHQLENEAIYSSILTITVGDKEQPAILKDLQRHPAKQQIMHVDLQRVLDDERIRMNVPLHFVGEDVAPGVKQGGVVSHLMTEVEITCFPKDLPEYFDVDVSALEIDDMLHLSVLKTEGSVEIVQLAQGDDHDQPIVAIHVPKAAPVEEEEVSEEPDAEAPAEEAPEGEDESSD